MLQRLPRLLLVALVAAASVLVGADSATAVNRWTIQANSPKPEVCGNSGTIPAGTWLQNKPCGYAIGTALAGWAFDNHETTPSNYHYGRIHGTNNFCAWIPPGALAQYQGSVPASCSATTRERLWHRRSFGYNFNAPAHAKADGSWIAVRPGCYTFYNYFNSSAFDSGSLRDFAGYSQSQVAYRYTANGGQAMMVRDPAIGWVFMPLWCVTNWQGVTFYNDND